MSPRSPIFTLVLAGGAWLLSGCAPQTPLPSEKTAATRQIVHLIPKGSTEARATKALVERGFVISRLSSDHASNHLLVATYSNTERLWQVGLVIVDTRVAATSVTITDLSAPTHLKPH